MKPIFAVPPMRGITPPTSCMPIHSACNLISSSDKICISDVRPTRIKAPREVNSRKKLFGGTLSTARRLCSDPATGKEQVVPVENTQVRPCATLELPDGFSSESTTSRLILFTYRLHDARSFSRLRLHRLCLCRCTARLPLCCPAQTSGARHTSLRVSRSLR
jgi:hypothetical protein